MKPVVIISNTWQETEALGIKLAKSLISGGVICLYGNLGTGKTTFVKGLAKGLGIKQRIISPTFVIIRGYKIKLPVSSSDEVRSSHRQSMSRTVNLYHADLYRLSSEQDLENLGFRDLFAEANNIVVIEWPEKITAVLPKTRWEIYFEHLTEEKRKITIKKFSI